MSTPVPAEPAPSAAQPEASRFPIVGIGGSAGGLEALNKLFAAMPADSGIAFVLVPHLDPAHASLMVPVLAKSTAMPVSEVQQGMRIEPNHVYVIPPNRLLTVRAGVLYLTEPVEAHASYAAIDWFLRSLAEDQREHAICILLSGTGSHGTAGMRAIKANDGATFVQDPATAEFPQMPENAIAAGLADQVLSAERMPAAMLEYCRRLHLYDGSAIEASDRASENLDRILALLSAKSQIDFRNYRKGSLLRRTERRMSLARMSGGSEYLAYLHEHPDEVELLAKDFMISVTQFFREPEAFKVLEATVIPDLVRRKSDAQPLRVWVPGCATGEEAYSIAILFLEHLSAANKHCPLKIFASDVDEAAVRFARAGIYPASISADVSAARLEKFFRPVDQHSYQVDKQLRESLVFATQNLVGDPPFSRLDLISCRNVLIYLQLAMQERVIAMFHFVLNEEGYLLLGPSETVGRHVELFEQLSTKWRVYRRMSGVTRQAKVDLPLAPGTARLLPADRLLDTSRPRYPKVAELTQRLLLAEYAPAAVLTNLNGEIVYFHGATPRYLDLPPGKPTFDLLAMAREGLRAKLRTAVQKAAREHHTVVIDDARVRRDGGELRVRVTVRPLPGTPNAERLLLVTFEDVQQAPSQNRSPEPASDDSLARQLEFDLTSTREELESTIEELQSTNEELQSSNEELEMSKEELQSLNEELTTSNVQLNEKVRELEQLNDDMSNLIGSIDQPTVFLDVDFRIRWFTPSSTRLLSLLPGDIGRLLTDIAPKFDDPDLLQDARQVLQTLQSADKEIKGAQDQWWLRRILPYVTPNRKIEGVVITFTDVSAMVQAAARDRRLAAVLMDSNDAITVLDLEGNIAGWNRGATRMYGYSETEALQLNIRELIPEPLRAEELTLHGRLLRGQLLDSRETQRIAKDGTVRDIWLTATTLRDQHGKPNAIATTERDITGDKAIAQIQHLATHDPLTGLSNRVLMVDLASHALVQARRTGGRIAMLFVDLDRFKTINDSLGHHTGDRLLQAVAERLKQCVRAGDTVARQGGDEFIVVLPDIADAQDATNVAEKIRHAMSAPLMVDGLELVSSASIGVSLYPDDASDIDTLLKHADAAMYRAKAQGRNTLRFFTPDLNTGALERLSMENSLRRALEREELHVHYQPQVDLATGRIIGVEALMRWEHPDLGEISPSKFIPVAEESGLIVPLGEWILLQACRQAKSWQQSGLRPTPVAVNISALQFRQPKLAETIARILQESGLSAEYLELELTESIVMQQVETGITSMQRLWELGLRISIDDFGTGYSSLSYLRRFPIHRLKIDLSFMHDVTTDVGAAAVTSAIIAMANSLHLRGLAEGVETREQLALLREQGCHELQGYYFSRPVPADQLATLLKEDRLLR